MLSRQSCSVSQRHSKIKLFSPYGIRARSDIELVLPQSCRPAGNGAAGVFHGMEKVHDLHTVLETVLARVFQTARPIERPVQLPESGNSPAAVCDFERRQARLRASQRISVGCSGVTLATTSSITVSL